MGRKEPCQNKHTSPETAGRDNINVELLPKDTSNDNTTQAIIAGQIAAAKKLRAYKGKWTENKFLECTNDYFVFSAENKVKLCIAGLCLWLDCTKETLLEWAKNPVKHGYKTEIIKKAMLMIEMSYIARVEKYPTGNAFLLKTSHGHIEASKLDITSNGQQMITSETEIQEMVSKLGLDK